MTPGLSALLRRRAFELVGPPQAALSLPELARQLLALEAPIDESLARRMVGTALGYSPEALPSAIDRRTLARLVTGPQATAPLEVAEFVVVDLETTGLSVARCTILEIGAVRVAIGRDRERFQSLVNPGRPIPDAITTLTGLDADAVAGAPPLGEAVERFRAWLAQRPHAPLVAHHAAFDTRFLDRAFEEHGLEPLMCPVLCTRRLARRLLPELGRFGLDALSAHFGISNRARHRALGDAEATARAFVELLALAREKAGIRTLGELIDLEARTPARLRKSPDQASPG